MLFYTRPAVGIYLIYAHKMHMKPAVLKHLTAIPTEITHQGTTHQKRLVTSEEKHKGTIATMNYAWLEPGMQLAAHTHPDGEEFYLFLEGTGQILVGDTWMPVDTGSFVTIPAGDAHSVKNSGKTILTFITVRTVIEPGP